ncbi:MAG: calcium/proton exchanger, partial [Crocosphaera sp.]
MLKTIFEKSIVVLLLILVPLSLAANVLNWGKSFVFIYSILSIIPLSIGLSLATEKVAIATGPTLGGLVNAIFGSATALIIALVALKEGLVDLVKASITGSILSDLLLFLGLAMLTGGIRYKEQEFQPILARTNGLSMTLGVIAIALPTLAINTSNLSNPEAIKQISLIVATILMIVYGLTLLFSLKTHSYLYDVSLAIETESDSFEEKELSHHGHELWLWIGVLLLMTIGVTFESELFIEDIDSVIDGFGFTPLFTGVILLPLLSDIAGIITVVRLALKNKMDLTVATATGDSLLITLFVAPLLILIGVNLNQEMDLNFNSFEVVALAVAVTVTNLISFSGRSNWLDGT